MTKGRDTKPHIGIFGRRNNGKSSLINTLAGQDIAIVSESPGTTTDPVKKSMEIPGIGAVILIDTAGIDDVGELGVKRIEKSMQALATVDLAILVIAENQFDDPEKALIKEFSRHSLPYIIVHNKADQHSLESELRIRLDNRYQVPILDFSCQQEPETSKLVALIKEVMPESALQKQTLVGDLISYGDVVLLITPIDIEAPEGRMILPQVQVIRDVLDHDGVAIVLKEREVDAFIKKMNPRPALVITDSQVFLKADASVPKDIPLTSFSIVLARQKGDFVNYLKGTPALGNLKDGDKVLILESCTHHVSCDDIGRMKIPRWLNQFSGKRIEYVVISGLSPIPEDITSFAIVIQCGGCVITKKQIMNRVKPFVDAGVPVTNYGMAIAYMHGIYERAIGPFVALSDHSRDYL
ncbi:MAG: [FeFe] hydrogenase H-cluster maturation GTPase HydF [Bacteroidota bacterium]